WGPRARDALHPVTLDDVSSAAFPYMTARTIEIAGVPVLAQRVTYVGELGWELYMRPEHAGEVWDALIKAGQPYGIRPAGYKCLDSLRLEKGYRYWSSDITPSENPFEAGLGFCVKLTKGDFIGRETLLKIKAEGALRGRKLCTITVKPQPVPPLSRGLPIEQGLGAGTWAGIYGGEPVYADGRLVGRLRSAGYGYTVGQYIGYVYLPLELASVGTPLEVEVFGERFPTQVAADVLYDPKGERLRV
ncbi:MAG: aminomethyltransferase family protein, partial [Anaerolineales bacterium]